MKQAQSKFSLVQSSSKTKFLQIPFQKINKANDILHTHKKRKKKKEKTLKLALPVSDQSPCKGLCFWLAIGGRTPTRRRARSTA